MSFLSDEITALEKEVAGNVVAPILLAVVKKVNDEIPALEARLLAQFAAFAAPTATTQTVVVNEGSQSETTPVEHQ